MAKHHIPHASINPGSCRYKSHLKWQAAALLHFMAAQAPCLMEKRLAVYQGTEVLAQAIMRSNLYAAMTIKGD